MNNEPVIKRLVLSRYLFELARQNVRAEQETGDAATVNLLQDATEIFLVACLDHHNANLKPRAEFSNYLDKLSETLDWPMPLRRRLLEINKVRVASKHDGIAPNRTEVDGYVADTGSFLEQVCLKALGEDFWTVSLVDLLEQNEPAEFLRAAEAAHKAGKYPDCLIECRKAFFVTFEKEYDLQTDSRATFALFGSRAPYFASERDKEKIKQRVTDPFLYIYLDHGQVDQDLMTDGIDHTAFWNVWRLTPSVYRYEKGDPWRVKHEQRLFAAEGIKERSAVVLSTMTSILLARQTTKRAARYISTVGFSECEGESGNFNFPKGGQQRPHSWDRARRPRKHSGRLCDPRA